jgi:hypothetical protein
MQVKVANSIQKRLIDVSVSQGIEYEDNYLLECRAM